MKTLSTFTLMTIALSFLMSEDIDYRNEIYIKSSKALVWNALVIPKEVSRYYMCPMIKSGTKIDDPIEFGAGKTAMIGGKITEFIINESFSYTFKFDPEEKDSAENYPTSVSIKISEDKGITKLILVHSGFKDKGQTYADITGGWPWILSNMKTYLETGKTFNDK